MASSTPIILSAEKKLELWLKHAEKEGWSLDEQIGRLWQAVDGVFV